MESLETAGESSVLAFADVCATLVTEIVIALLIVAGAVNSPLLDMVPALADHVTAELLVLVTAAANCIFPPGATEGFKGEICTVTHDVHGLIAIV